MTIIEINGNKYNSYADVHEADQYLDAKYGSNWITYDDEKKKLLLVNATREIDKKEYKGEKADSNQPLKFPRKICSKLTDENIIRQAVFELADNLSKTLVDSVVSSVNLNAVKSMKVGDTDITFKDDAVIENASNTLNNVINDYLKPYLKGNAEIWL